MPSAESEEQSEMGPQETWGGFDEDIPVESNQEPEDKNAPLRNSGLQFYH